MSAPEAAADSSSCAARTITGVVRIVVSYSLHMRGCARVNLTGTCGGQPLLCVVLFDPVAGGLSNRLLALPSLLSLLAWWLHGKARLHVRIRLWRSRVCGVVACLSWCGAEVPGCFLRFCCLVGPSRRVARAALPPVDGYFGRTFTLCYWWMWREPSPPRHMLGAGSPRGVVCVRVRDCYECSLLEPWLVACFRRPSACRYVITRIPPFFLFVVLLCACYCMRAPIQSSDCGFAHMHCCVVMCFAGDGTESGGHVEPYDRWLRRWCHCRHAPP